MKNCLKLLKKQVSNTLLITIKLYDYIDSYLIDIISEKFQTFLIESFQMYF